MYTSIEELRQARNEALGATDWCVLSDVTLEESTLVIVLLYRQALRDFPIDTSDLETVELPLYPAELTLQREGA